MMEHREKQPYLTLSPSLGEILEETTAVHQESTHHICADDDDDNSSDDFEFTFAVRDPVAETSITADEIFSPGRVLPVYPVFDRNLLSTVGEPSMEVEEGGPLRRLVIEDRGSSSSKPVGEYCSWSPRSVPPSPERCKKSASTGSARRWRLRDLVMGRSHSDGKEKFVFIAAASPAPPSTDKTTKPPAKTKAANAAAKKGGRVTEVDLLTAHRLYYGKGNGEKMKGGRRSFLPYRQELVGFFANVDGFSRTHHPF